jgi:glycosyltransferase involved in cell wall biosynthesis
MTTLPWLIEIGDENHGVARYSRQLSAQVERASGANRTLGIDALPDHGADRVHVHFTDRLWAPSPELAAERFERLAATATVTVTLHDVPQPSDGPVNQRRRSECYLRVVAAASGVACNSEHEAALLSVFTDVTPVVIPIPVDTSPLGIQPVGKHLSETQAPALTPSRPRSGSLDGNVAILGYFYPGKGHREAVDAVAQLGRDSTGVTALGKASAGHESELADLIAHAHARGVAFTATGFLSDENLAAACREASVPLAAHQHVSASASLATWISAGRKPLIPNTRYSQEMLALRPGTATLYEPPLLALAIAAALDAPESTWLADDAVTGPDSAATARRYISWWETVAW